MDIREIAGKARAFKSGLDNIKSGLAPDFSWYPYDSLASFDILDRLLRGERRRLLELTANRPVLDLGCADGDTAFFLESLGCEVVAVDHPGTNWNEMRGVKLLKEALHSAVEIRAVDIDTQFALGQAGHSLALALGVLYHLRNPFYFLWTLAQHASYAIVSTRVARFTPDHRTRLRDQPLAYLLEECEVNDDATNYWIFSEGGLQRLFQRTKWDLLDYMTVGNTVDSDPVRAEGDERAFALLKSAVSDSRRELLAGWHELENDTWRWTERRFAVAFHRPAGNTLRLRFSLPGFLVGRLHDITVRAFANGVPLAPETYFEAGEQVYLRKVAAREEVVRIDFEVDKALAPDADDARERGLVVLSVALE